MKGVPKARYSNALRACLSTVLNAPPLVQMWEWGDTFDDELIGSKLWLLLWEKLTSETLIKAREYGEEALQLIEDEVATDVRVNVCRFSLEGIAIDVGII